MKKSFWIVVIFISLLIPGLIYFYNYAGLKYFVRAISIINSNDTNEKKEQSWNIFNNESEGFYSGIYAGIFVNKVGVWGKSGLKLFNTDEYSVFRYIDSCSPAIIDEIATGKGQSYRSISFGLSNDWLEVVKVGDYAIVVITKSINGGKVGNLREIYVYNRWPFVQKDIYTECAK